MLKSWRISQTPCPFLIDGRFFERRSLPISRFGLVETQTQGVLLVPLCLAVVIVSTACAWVKSCFTASTHASRLPNHHAHMVMVLCWSALQL